MKRLLLFIIATLSFWHSTYAYDFCAVAPTGQTLYYNIVSNGVVVVYPGSSINNNFWVGYSH